MVVVAVAVMVAAAVMVAVGINFNYETVTKRNYQNIFSLAGLPPCKNKNKQGKHCYKKNNLFVFFHPCTIYLRHA